MHTAVLGFGIIVKSVRVPQQTQRDPLGFANQPAESLTSPNRVNVWNPLRVTNSPIG
jgi:hypothetical protein